MLIDALNLLYAEKTQTGYKAEIELETADNLEFSGSIEIDSDWNYDLGFLATFVNTDEDKIFVHSVLSSEDFKNDVRNFIPS
jgi:hypothetical protein